LSQNKKYFVTIEKKKHVKEKKKYNKQEEKRIEK
jgi:hypothetical protein